ncbi:MAG: hypothetical protein H0U80_02820, partial [Solirubrobacterales bacterium]|nr:hypothetical protein [Solirubrobacterales bacterium]
MSPADPHPDPPFQETQPMSIDFAEILHDLELKRAAALAPAQRPEVDVGPAVAGLDAATLDLAVVDEDGA